MLFITGRAGVSPARKRLTDHPFKFSSDRLPCGTLQPGIFRARDCREIAPILGPADDQTHRLNRLAGQLLDVSRIRDGRLALDRAPTNLVGLVANVDPLRLEQVLTNHVDNAAKYAGKGGPIVLTAESSGPNALIGVRDHGPGIPAADRDRVFERFYRGPTHQYVAGIGLGPAISQEMVHLHGGQISVEFPTDGGARFVVRLPLS